MATPTPTPTPTATRSIIYWADGAYAVWFSTKKTGFSADLYKALEGLLGCTIADALPATATKLQKAQNAVLENSIARLTVSLYNEGTKKGKQSHIYCPFAKMEEVCRIGRGTPAIAVGGGGWKAKSAYPRRKITVT